LFRAAGCTDALIKKMPLERELYEEASGRMIVFKQFERCLVYLEPRDAPGRNCYGARAV